MDSPAFNPIPGQSETLEPGLRRLLAPNPSPMTFRGTNTYLLGTEHLVVIDPGPAIDSHLTAILDAAGTSPITHILVTHAHLDHSALARPLAEATGAPVLAFGGPQSGRSPLMQDLAEQGLIGGGEGVDRAFVPDIVIGADDSIEIEDEQISCVWTPGHMAHHLAFGWRGALFTGDVVMGWASSLVSPPDGDLGAFMATCNRLRTRQDRIFYPAHGAPIETPQARLDWLIAHRRQREAQISAALATRPHTAADLTLAIYDDVPPALLPAAQRNVLAHLIDLTERGTITATPTLHPEAVFSRVGGNGGDEGRKNVK
ncbi:MAG: MBL fold metallo-hydrolase [Qingshengfaniella sp.]